jgi:hypothetical protein
MKLLIAFLAILFTGFLPTLSHAQIYVADGPNITEWDQNTDTELNSVAVPTGELSQSLVLIGNTLYDANLTTTDQAGGLNSPTEIISTYNATTLAPINTDFATISATVSPFITNDYSAPVALVAQGNNIFLANGAYYNSNIDEIDATTGAVSVFADLFFTTISGLALEGNTLYVSNWGSNVVAAYDTTTGNLTNPDVVTLVNGDGGSIAIAGNTLFLDDFALNTIGAYNATTGTYINSSFLTGPGEIGGITISGDNLYVEDDATRLIADYDPNTGAFIADVAEGASFISDANIFTGSTIASVGAPDDTINPPVVPGPYSVNPPGSQSSTPESTPEPKSVVMCFAVFAGFLALRRKFQTNGRVTTLSGSL